MNPNDSEKEKLNSNTSGDKTTKVGWVDQVDRCVVKAVPIWFSFLGWITLVGGIRYLGEKHDSFILNAIFGLSLLFIMLYLYATFEKINYSRLFNIKCKKVEYLIISLLSITVVLSCNYVIGKAILEVSEASAVEKKPENKK